MTRHGWNPKELHHIIRDEALKLRQRRGVELHSYGRLQVADGAIDHGKDRCTVTGVAEIKRGAARNAMLRQRRVECGVRLRGCEELCRVGTIRIVQRLEYVGEDTFQRAYAKDNVIGWCNRCGWTRGRNRIVVHLVQVVVDLIGILIIGVRAAPD